MSAGARRIIACAASATACALLALASACATPLRAGADFEDGLDLEGYRTFTWDEGDALPTGDPKLDSNPFFVERFHRAIAAALQNRGIAESTEDPDLLVHHHFAVRDRVDVVEADRSLGYDPGRMWESEAQTFRYEEGTFLVDIVDARTQTVLWRGWAQTDVQAALNDPDRMEELLVAAVTRMFEDLPAP